VNTTKVRGPQATVGKKTDHGGDGHGGLSEGEERLMPSQLMGGDIKKPQRDERKRREGKKKASSAKSMEPEIRSRPKRTSKMTGTRRRGETVKCFKKNRKRGERGGKKSREGKKKNELTPG